MLREEILDNFEVSIDPQVILLVHGYGEEKKPRQNIIDMVSRVAEEAGGLIRPRAVYREFAVAGSDTESVTLENGIQLATGRKISSLWKGSRALGIALYTLGPELEDRVSALLEEGEQMQALNLDIWSIFLKAGCPSPRGRASVLLTPPKTRGVRAPRHKH